MMYLVTGGSGSGKSAYAEDLIHKIAPQNKYYLATMQAYDEESLQKIEKHKKLREKKNFLTIEKPIAIHTLKLEKKDSILLECLSNLVANEMFDELGAKEDTQEVISKGILLLKKESQHQVIVGNEVFCDVDTYDTYTKEYLKNLSNIMEFVAKQADVVIEVVYGIPIILKGGSICKN